MENTDRYSPSLSGDLQSWEALVKYGREYGPKDVLERFFRTLSGSKESIETGIDDDGYVISSESQRIKTLSELLEHTEADLSEYNVTRYVTNKWDQHSVSKGLVELFQVKAWLNKKYLDKPDREFYNKWLDSVGSILETHHFVPSETDDDIVLTLADLHAGALIDGEGLVPDYNLEELEERLTYIASVANTTYAGKGVHVKFLGDFIESFTGKNHKDTWQQIEKHGMEVALVAFDLILSFLQSIENLKTVDIVGGNHDRITASNEEDKKGQVAYLISELLKRTYKDLPVRFHDRIVTATHDDVCYVITHGDKKITKMEPAKLILEYGDQNKFNVLLNAHGHEEKIHDTSIRYVSHQIPPVVTSGVYARDNGWTSPSGFCVFMKSPRNGVERYTHAL